MFVSIKKFNSIIRFTLEPFKKNLDRLPLYVNVAVGDLLFRGYKDETTRLIAKLKSIIRRIGLDLKLPKSIDSEDGHFSLLRSVS